MDKLPDGVRVEIHGDRHAPIPVTYTRGRLFCVAGNVSTAANVRVIGRQLLDFLDAEEVAELLRRKGYSKATATYEKNPLNL